MNLRLNGVHKRRERLMVLVVDVINQAKRVTQAIIDEAESWHQSSIVWLL